MVYKVGTVTELEKAEAEQRKRSSRLGNSGSAGGNGGNGGRDNGGGGDRNNGDNNTDEELFSPDKYKIGMWVALLAISMTFSALIAVYMALALNRQQEWRPFDLPYQIYLSTAIIIASSLTYEFARRAIQRGKQIVFRKWLIATVVLGGVFLAVQLSTWLALVNQGVYVAGNPYAGFFYILTVAHAVHLIGGVLALGYLVLKTAQPTEIEENLFKRQTAASVVGYYWHSMDALWLVLFALLAFWK
jgi:cytochrome c oxidase subunit 3